MKAYIFPGQGSQFVGMGKTLCQNNIQAQHLFNEANKILGFNITDIMFNGTDDDLRQTKVTQPAVFLHAAILFLTQSESIMPNAVAGHSLGEFTALVANKTLAFEDALILVSLRAQAMQYACELEPSTMAAVLGLDDEKVEQTCSQVTDDIVVPANYNCPGQLVISGTKSGIEKATPILKLAGAKRVLPLNVAGAFHSPLMLPAQEKLMQAIAQTNFKTPICPVYQNVNARPTLDAQLIQQQLIAQLTAPVKWTQTIQQMVKDGFTSFVECGPGNVLQGLVKKTQPDAMVSALEE
jgi:[acyl-carrier-protein] S-malonyltransferase